MRVVLFVSGCHHHCPGCFNEPTWNPCFGKPFTEEVIDNLIEKINKPYIKGLSLCGGEPFYVSNRKPLLDFVRQVKKECPGKDIWCYTGAEYEDLLPGGKEFDQTGYELLRELDVLVAGPFLIEQKDLTIAFRGSRNQYIVDVQESLKKEKRIILSID